VLAVRPFVLLFVRFLPAFVVSSRSCCRFAKRLFCLLVDLRLCQLLVAFSGLETVFIAWLTLGLLLDFGFVSARHRSFIRSKSHKPTFPGLRFPSQTFSLLTANGAKLLAY
jgi:hypothetical protein